MVEIYRVVVVRQSVVGYKEIPGILPSLRPKFIEIVAGQRIGPARYYVAMGFGWMRHTSVNFTQRLGTNPVTQPEPLWVAENTAIRLAEATGRTLLQARRHSPTTTTAKER